MTKEQFEKAEILVSMIGNEEIHIDSYERLGECKELLIIQHTEEVKKAVDSMYFSRESPAPKYITGDKLKLLITTLKNSHEERLKQLQKEFENL